jgi:hypothetical protein
MIPIAQPGKFQLQSRDKMDEVRVNDDNEVFGHPQWYLDGYETLQKFVNLPDEKRAELVGEASAVFMTTLVSLAPAGYPLIADTGMSFFNTSLEAIGDKFAGMSREDLLLLLLGVAVQSIGVQQMKIQDARVD